MDGKQKDEGGVAAFLVAGCLVVISGLVFAYAGLVAFIYLWEAHNQRSRAAAQQVEQQAARARVVRTELEAATKAQEADSTAHAKD